MEQTYFGQVKKAIIKFFLKQDDGTTTSEQKQVIKEINTLASAKNTADIIAGIDHIYNELFDQTFEQKHGNLKKTEPIITAITGL